MSRTMRKLKSGSWWQLRINKRLGSHHAVNEANAALVTFKYVLRLEWRESLSKHTFTNFSLEVLLLPPNISYGQLFL